MLLLIQEPHNKTIQDSPDSAAGAKPGRTMIRRKSYLPADFDTAMALQQYHTVDTVLPSSKET